MEEFFIGIHTSRSNCFTLTAKVAQVWLAFSNRKHNSISSVLFELKLQFLSHKRTSHQPPSDTRASVNEVNNIHCGICVQA